MMDDLKLCPFCGSRAGVISEPRVAKDYSVYCTNLDCGVNGVWDLERSRAIEQWNTRPLEDDLLEALEIVAEAWGIADLDDAQFRGYLDNCIDEDEQNMWKKVRAAIAKAKGERVE